MNGIKKVLRYGCLLAIALPLLASAHDYAEGEFLPHIVLHDRGELILSGDDITYQPWDSEKLKGKVRIVQYIAGRKSAKKKNSLIVKAIKMAHLPEDRFQPTTIVNADDIIPGTGIFVVSKVEKNKRRYPWAQFIIDDQGSVQKAWRLDDASSAIIVLDAKGQIRWIKEGALSPDDVFQVMTVLHRLLRARDS